MKTRIGFLAATLFHAALGLLCGGPLWLSGQFSTWLSDGGDFKGWPPAKEDGGRTEENACDEPAKVEETDR